VAITTSQRIFLAQNNPTWIVDFVFFLAMLLIFAVACVQGAVAVINNFDG